MLFRIRCGLSIAIPIMIAAVSLFSQARLAAQTPPVRYHFGDDPKWANPAFDDSAWPVAAGPLLPAPPAASDGMVWLRYRVAVPPDRSPLALRLDRDNGGCSPAEFWVNGVFVGSQGSFPSEPFAAERCVTGVFNLPGGVASPGETAVIAWRGWLSPIWRSRLDFSPPVLFNASIGSRALEIAQESSARARLRLWSEIDRFLWILESLIALALLVLWRRARAGASLFWFPVFLLCWCGYGSWWYLWPPGANYIGFWFGVCCFWAAVNIARFEFMRAVLPIPRWAVRVLEGIGILWPLGLFLPALAVGRLPAPGLIVAGLYVLTGITFAGQIAFAAWAWVRGPKETRGLAITLFCAGVAYLLVDDLNFFPGLQIAGYGISTDHLATALVTVAMCYQLLGRLWTDWRRKEDLDAEFEAAREVQELLVVPAVDVAGFRIESAYAPARQVGGDFFRVLPVQDGGVLVVVGDVSGKGLKAAMTVSAIMGALHDYPSNRPTEVLAHLNRVLYGRVGGFVTCCAARIAADGGMTLANAGNPAPYRNGHEMTVEPGLPLGLISEAAYTETSNQLALGDLLTFVSDGVVEATNPSGELFGFERTQKVSTQPAHAIAAAVIEFGQEDDITVLTLTRQAGAA